MPMVNFFSKDKIDFLGRFENFERDLLTIKKTKDINFSSQNFKNSHKFSDNYDYLKFYEDKENIEIVEDIYQDDFKSFDYNFESFKNFEKSKNTKNSIEPNIKLHKKEVKFKRFLKRYVKKKLYMSLNNDKFNW